MSEHAHRRRGALALVLLRLSLVGCAAAFAGVAGLAAWRVLSGL